MLSVTLRSKQHNYNYCTLLRGFLFSPVVDAIVYRALARFMYIHLACLQKEGIYLPISPHGIKCQHREIYGGGGGGRGGVEGGGREKRERERFV